MIEVHTFATWYWDSDGCLGPGARLRKKAICVGDVTNNRQEVRANGFSREVLPAL